MPELPQRAHFCPARWSTDPDVIFEETRLALNWLAVADKKDLARPLVGVLGLVTP
jgi:hypothetical protein